ncbi:MAG: thioredoxin family protein [Sedimentisphaerales bacterium]|nr:thioredoxin family protein [Sedimentisphaerales bacterium]
MSDNQINQNESQPVNPEPNLPRPTCACSMGKGPWFWFAVALAIAIGVITVTKRGTSLVSGDGVVWNENYNSALELSKSENKPILLAFTSPGCTYCNQMKKTTYRDPEVVKVSENFIPVMVNADEDAELSQKYNIYGLPTYVVISPDGRELGNFPGYYPADEFISLLKKTL